MDAQVTDAQAQLKQRNLVPLPLSVLIPCKNERPRIAACLESVSEIAAEIVVADNGSTDGTLEFLRNQPRVRIIEREYRNPADFKNWAIPQCQQPWVLTLDADERLSPELIQELQELLRQTPPADGYYLRFRNFFFGLPIHYGSFGRDKVLRLFRKDVAHYLPGTVHEHLHVTTGRVGQLQGRVLHYSIDSFEQYLEKTNRYSTWAAEGMKANGKRTSLLQMAFRPCGTFLRDYLVWQGWRDGYIGLVAAVMSALYVFLKHSKLWLLHTQGGLSAANPPSTARQSSPGHVEALGSAERPPNHHGNHNVRRAA